MTLLDSLVEINPRLDPVSAVGPISVIAVPDIETTTATAYPRVVPNLEDTGSARRTACAGDVLFARISPSMENGKVAIVPELETRALVVSGELLVLRPKFGVDPRLIWAFLRRRRVREELKAFMTGSSGHQRLSADVVSQIDVPEPGEKRWSKGSRALDAFDRARALRTAIADLAGALPAAAAWAVAAKRPRARLASFGADLRYGTSERSSPQGSVPVLRIPNVVEGRVELDDLRYMSEGRKGPTDLLEHGDLLVVRTNGNPERLGRSAVFESEPAGASFASYLIRVRTDELDPDFLWAWMQTGEARSALLREARTTAGQYNLNTSILRELPVPRVEPEEEAAIAALARHARALAVISAAQHPLLDQAVESHLAALFDRATASVPEEAGKGLAPATVFLPGVFDAASEAQRQLWADVLERGDNFVLADLGRSETEYATLQRSLGLLEQLGVLVRDQTGEAHSWRRPDPEWELLK